MKAAIATTYLTVNVKLKPCESIKVKSYSNEELLGGHFLCLRAVNATDKVNICDFEVQLELSVCVECSAACFQVSEHRENQNPTL